ncbi:MAG TPA: NAD+ synthase [Gemmatimonadales bacterium]|nr:NAD+ synthase [Gemmatimonadales bacterium]
MPRLAIAQFRPTKGAYVENLARVGALFREMGAWPEPPDIVLFPEAALTGYFLEGGVRELAVEAPRLYADLAARHAESGAPPVDVAIGFYELHENRLHNAALYATLGGTGAGIRHVHRKVFLPTYGVFDEERFVEAGKTVHAFDTRFGRTAMLVCEDAWHSLMPTLAALDGAQLILIPSATPARGLDPRDHADGRPANLERWERLAQGIAEEHGVYVAVSQLVGFEGGKGFAGGSVLLSPRGETLLQGPVFEPAVLTAALDPGEITRVRADQPLLSDLEHRLPHLLEGREQTLGRSVAPELGARRERQGRNAAPEDGREPRSVGASARLSSDPLRIDPALARTWLVEFIRDEVQRRRGFEHVVIGLSGGVDSALVAYLAAEALGPDNVTAVRMPYRTSSPESLAHAELVIRRLGLAERTVDISAAVDGLVAAIGGEVDGARRGNVMARMRMITLFDLSAALKALPLGTGNKSERLLGYFTWHADDSPPVNPIGDLFKTQVWALARHLGVPEEIVGKPASADLIQGQTDEGDFGISYAKADLILHWLLSGLRPVEIEPLGFTAAEVALVRGRLDSTHWKRRLPTVAMLSQTSIGEYYLRPVDF